MTHTLRQRFGQVVRVTREDRGWSQEQLAAALGISLSSLIARFELGTPA